MNLPRRRFLCGAGVALALPLLDAMTPAIARANPQSGAPRRLVCICTPLGVHTPYLFPSQTGRHYELTPYLEVLRQFRDDFTVISGLSHPDVGYGHASISSFLTAAPMRTKEGFRNTISLDQFVADRLGRETRFPSLVLAGEGTSLSWTRTGAVVPAEGSPSRVFARLFLDGRPEEVRSQVRRLRDGHSILDKVGEQARSMQAGLGSNDQRKLDEYFTSVRELEQRLTGAEQWSKKPKPKVDVPPPRDIPGSADLIGKTRLLFDLTHLALQTDSTRFITICLGSTSAVPPIPGVTMGHHDLSHHGQDPTKLAQLKTLETQKLSLLRDLLAKLQQSQEEGAALLDRTTVLFGSNLGSGSGHSTKNLPILLAGGGFKHGSHLAFDQKENMPLCNLFVSILQRLGVEADKFGSSTGTLTGLEV